VEIVFDTLDTFPEPEKSAIPVGQNFFYEIKETKDERHFSYVESGIGEFYKKSNKIFFKREYVFSVVSNKESSENYKPFQGKPPKIEQESDSKLILTRYLPESYQQILASKNSVLCSTEPFTPTPVELQDNTLLGKLNNIIQSIDQNELWSILLQNNKKPVEGSIRYNKKQKCFQGYDGKEWRTLMWGEE
jgi:hypothetical protein